MRQMLAVFLKLLLLFLTVIFLLTVILGGKDMGSVSTRAAHAQTVQAFRKPSSSVTNKAITYNHRISENSTEGHICVEFPVYHEILCVNLDRNDAVSESVSKGVMYDSININRLLLGLFTKNIWGFIDIGADIGIYSVPAACAGHWTIAVESDPDNVKLIEKSLILSGGTALRRTTLLHKGIAAGHFNITLQEWKSNALIHPNSSRGCTNGPVCNEEMVETLTLDDLLVIKRNKFTSAFMRMNSGIHDIEAVLASTRFWRELNVAVIQMEWLSKVTNVHTMDMIDFLQLNGYVPHDMTYLKPLLGKDWQTDWGREVYWIKKGFSYQNI